MSSYEFFKSITGETILLFEKHQYKRNEKKENSGHQVWECSKKKLKCPSVAFLEKSAEGDRIHVQTSHNHLPKKPRKFCPEKRVHQCRNCPKRFQDYYRLKSHNQNSHHSKNIRCNACNINFLDYRYFKLHKELHEKETIFIKMETDPQKEIDGCHEFFCEICSKDFESLRSKLDHASNDHGSHFFCLPCKVYLCHTTGIYLHRKKHADSFAFAMMINKSHPLTELLPEIRKRIFGKKKKQKKYSAKKSPTNIKDTIQDGAEPTDCLDDKIEGAADVKMDETAIANMRNDADAVDRYAFDTVKSDSRTADEIFKDVNSMTDEKSISKFCTFCNRKFNKVRHRLDHENDIHKGRRFKCNVCGKVLKHRCESYSHRKHHHGGKATFAISFLHQEGQATKQTERLPTFYSKTAFTSKMEQKMITIGDENDIDIKSNSASNKNYEISLRNDDENYNQLSAKVKDENTIKNHEIKIIDPFEKTSQSQVSISGSLCNKEKTIQVPGINHLEKIISNIDSITQNLKSSNTPYSISTSWNSQQEVFKNLMSFAIQSPQRSQESEKVVKSTIPSTSAVVQVKTKAALKTCCMCCLTFSDEKDAYRFHLLMHLDAFGGKIVCPLCNLNCGTNKSMTDHYMAFHGQLNKKVCPFEKCVRAFWTNAAAERHTQAHQKVE